MTTEYIIVKDGSPAEKASAFSSRSKDEFPSNVTVSESEPHPGRPATRISPGWLVVVLLLLIVAAIALRPRDSISGQDSPAIGKPAPRLDLVRLTENPLADRIDRLAGGEVTLIHFWGTWCGPCRIEYPELAAMIDRIESNPRFVFLSVSCEGGPGETFDSLRRKTNEYFASEAIEGNAFADPQGTTRISAAQRLERNDMFYPTSIVVDAEGKIAGVWEGYAPGSVEQMELLIERLLAAGPAAT